MKSVEHHFFLTSHLQDLSATCFLPESAQRTVLMIPPFMEERKGALPVMVRTARRLAEQGVATLLFDFSGCGDSSGTWEEATPERLEQNCRDAYGWLNRMFPSLPMTLLGVRTGAALALRQDLFQPLPHARVLWSPISGSDFFRQLVQRRMVNDMVAQGRARETRAALEDRLRTGENVDLDGYVLNGPIYQWLQSLTLSAPTQSVLLASGGHDEKTLEPLFASSADLTRSALRFPPFWNTVGSVDLEALTALTVEWLISHVSATPVPMVRPSSLPPSVCVEAELLTLDYHGDALNAIFDLSKQAPQYGALFLHGWSGDRTGPHRMFTLFARQLARNGCLCMRPDFIGRGFSAGNPADAEIRKMSEQAQLALTALRQRLPANAPILIVAICSGCKVAIEVASRNPDLDALLLWSAESMGSLRSSATGRRKIFDLLKTYLAKLTRPETWRKIMTGKIQTGMVTKALVKQETRSAEEAKREDEVLKTFRAFRHPIHFVFGGSDPDATGSRQAYATFCQTHRIPYTLHTIPHAGHSFYGTAWTDELFQVSLQKNPFK